MKSPDGTVWVIEMKMDVGTWQPTIGMALTREQARREERDWVRRNPCDIFRVRRYTRVPVARRKPLT